MGERIRTTARTDGGSGSRADYWETMWAEEKAAVPDVVLDAVAPRLGDARVVLESGCGPALYLELLALPHRTIVGVDRAGRALAAARQRDRDLDLAEADVGRLPFPDGTFDAVLSLGVVEHDPEGPVRLLREQRRVLAPDGRLVLTVPHANGLRRCTDTWHLGLRRRSSYEQGGRTVRWRRGTEATVGEPFHQYEFTPRQLRRRLHQAGFGVEEWVGLDVGTGLRDLRRPRAGRPSPGPDAPPAVGAAPEGWRRTVFSARPVGPFGTALRWAATRGLGHLQLVVARPVDPG